MVFSINNLPSINISTRTWSLYSLLFPLHTLDIIPVSIPASSGRQCFFNVTGVTTYASNFVIGEFSRVISAFYVEVSDLTANIQTQTSTHTEFKNKKIINILLPRSLILQLNKRKGILKKNTLFEDQTRKQLDKYFSSDWIFSGKILRFSVST